MNSKNDLKSLSLFLDSKFKIAGFKFGYDGLLGLIPVAGDVITMSLSMYIVTRALFMKYPTPILIKMVINILIENLIGIVPFFGNIFDFAWKSNLKNIKLLEQFDANPTATLKSNHRKILLMLLALIGVFIFMIYAIIKLTIMFFEFLF
jgi:hypothetical protein